MHGDKSDRFVHVSHIAMGMMCRTEDHLYCENYGLCILIPMATNITSQANIFHLFNYNHEFSSLQMCIG